jgi:ribose transport system substrate-binding protein
MSELPTPQGGSKRWLAYLVVFVIGVAIAVGVNWKANAALEANQPGLKKVAKIALVTANKNPFWDLVTQGAKDAAAGWDAELTVFSPTDDKDWQKKVLVEIQGEGFDGVAVSPNDPAGQADLLAKLAASTNMVTIDSDAHSSNRLCFIGIDNYGAGRTCGKYIAQAVPNGGEVILAVGSMDRENAQLRRQGIIDELSGRPYAPDSKPDPIDAPIKAGAYTIVATLVDGFDAAKAEQLAGEALAKNPNAKCLVGLYSYNAPAFVNALQKSGKSSTIQIIGFDVDDTILKHIEDGRIFATMSQDPYVFGAESVRLLADVSRGDRMFLPQSRQRLQGCEPVTKSDVARIREERAAKLRDPATTQASAGKVE